MTLSTLIFLALGFGVAVGAALHDWFPSAVMPLDHFLLDPLGQVFLRLIQFVVVPLVFSSMILALTRVKNAAQVGRYAIKLLGGYLLTSPIAVVIGMATASVLQSGVGLTRLEITAIETSTKAPDLIQWLIELIPTNPLAALSTGNLLQTIVSAALIGVGIQQAGTKAEPFVSFIESLYAISEKTFTMLNPKPGEIWLVRFPFSDLTSTKVRPAPVLATHRQDVIILGIFSKIPPATPENT